MSKKRTNYWPESVAAILIAAVFLLSWTIYKTGVMPVQEDNSFMTDYQDVDMRSDELLVANREFFNRFEIAISSPYDIWELQQEFYKKRGMTSKLIDPDEDLILQVRGIDGGTVEGASLEVLMSRPTTRVDDYAIDTKDLGEGKFLLSGIEFDKPGRWQLIIQAGVDEYRGFKNKELYIQ